MNIAFFSESYKPYISGVTVSLDTLAKALRRLGHRAYIFAPDYGRKHEGDADIFRFPSLPTFYPGFKVAIPFSRKISNALKGLKIDIVHSHSPFQLGLLGRRFARKAGIPFVYTFHTLFDQYLHYVPLLPGPLAKKIMSAHLRNFCNSSDAVVAPSNYVKEYLVREGIRTRVEVVPTGVDLEALKGFAGKGIRERYGIGPNDIVLLYVGRLSKEKNLPFLLDSLKLIIRETPAVRLLIAAGGPKEEELRRLAVSLGMSSHLIFAGQVKQPEVFNYFAASDIFVFASTTETQGLVIAEAASSGLPVVAVDAGGVSDAVIEGKTGYLVPHDVFAFSKKVSGLIKNEELRKKMSQEAARHARENFSAERYARRIEEIYKDLLS